MSLARGSETAHSKTLLQECQVEQQCKTPIQNKSIPCTSDKQIKMVPGAQDGSEAAHRAKLCYRTPALQNVANSWIKTDSKTSCYLQKVPPKENASHY